MKRKIIVVEFNIKNEVVAVWTKRAFNKYCKSAPKLKNIYWLEYELDKERGKVC